VIQAEITQKKVDLILETFKNNVINLTCWKLVSRASLCVSAALCGGANRRAVKSRHKQQVVLLQRRHSPLSSWAGIAGLASPLRNARATLGSGATAPAAAVAEAAAAVAAELPLRLGSALASSSRNCNHTRDAWKTTSWTRTFRNNSISMRFVIIFVQRQSSGCG
jgi:hypothetical protein